jgi:hypothetical protein
MSSLLISFIGFVAELQSKYANTVSNIMRTTEKLRPSHTFDPASVELPPDDDDSTPSGPTIVDLEAAPSTPTTTPTPPAALPTPSLPPLITSSAATPTPSPPLIICALCGRPVAASSEHAHSHGRTVIDEERTKLSAAGKLDIPYCPPLII